MRTELNGKLSAGLVAIAVYASTGLATFGQQNARISDMARKELERRQAAVQEAQMLLLKGDEAYEAKKYEDAANAYAGAMNAFPDAPATAELKNAAAQRYAQATVEHAREMTRKGDVKGAKEAVDKVLVEEIAKGDPVVEGYRAELDDPIRVNQSLTKEHAAKVDEVRRLFYKAEGAFDLGKYDEAQKNYEEILKIDRHNAAARRGMERVAGQKTEYAKSAYDEARARILGDVDAGWELPLQPDDVVVEAPVIEELNDLDGFVPMSNKLSRIIIPSYQHQGGTLMDAIDLLKILAAQNDTIARNESEKGINIAVNLGSAEDAATKKTFDLRLTNVPVEQILKYITELTGIMYRVEDYAITLLPLGSDADLLITRTYRVPPDFLSNLTAGIETEQAQDDIFNTDISEGVGIVARRMSVQQAFSKQGVLFPEGASAVLNPGSNMLRIVNTPANQDIMAQIVENISETEPVSVAVRVTMLKVQKSILEELSFDWMLDTFQFGGDSWIPGASELNLSGGTTGSGNPITDIAPIPGNLFPGNPITSGNRSGGFASTGNSLDRLIAESSLRSTQETFRAPGVFGVNGVVGGATVQMLMRGLDQKKGVDLMAQPSVTTRSNQEASVFIVREFIYPTEYEPPELPQFIGGGAGGGAGGGGQTTVTPSMPTAFESRDVGVALKVLPVADEKKRYINVTLNPSFSDFDGFVNFGSPIGFVDQSTPGAGRRILTRNEILMPVFSVQNVNTNMVVADGATIVIGGLLKEEITNVNDKTPVLSSIPLVGSLFKSNHKQHTSTALIFLVNVELIDPTGRPYRDR